MTFPNDVDAIRSLPSGELYIDGERTRGSGGETAAHINPATGKMSKEFTLAGPEDVDAAVSAARRAFPAWRRLPASQRRNLLLNLASIFEARAEVLAKITVLENGTPAAFAPFVASITPADWFRYYAGWADKLDGTVPPMLSGPGLNYSVRVPYGVIAILIAYNAPMAFIGMKAAAALAAGNCIVIKPSELAPWSALVFADLCAEAGLPRGVVSVIPGDSNSGRALVTHAGVDKVSFTGGGATASAILTAIAPRLTPSTMELGGKSANIVFEDANLTTAVSSAIACSVAMQSGQACIAGTRLLVQRSVYPRVLEQIEAAARALVVGDPTRLDTAMGPVISGHHCQRILNAVDRMAAEQQGKIVLRGSKKLGELSEGFYLEPTVFGDVDPASDLAQEEIFGPVLAVIPFDSEDEAVAIANRSRYGLAGYIFTESLSRALRVIPQIDAGTIAVNGANYLPVNLPFGGFKASGFGREGGKDGIDDMTHTKSVQIALTG
jgi:aldehyde dehydrogenase (NAD+)